MSANVFKTWFIDILKLLPEPRVIIMDSALHHSTVLNNYFKSNVRKVDVHDWLKNQGINFSPLEILVELCERVKLLTLTFKRYQLDAITNSMGHVVIQLNP